MISLNSNFQLWLINSGEVQKEVPTVSYQTSLSYHGSAVNILRFSPTGKNLFFMPLDFDAMLGDRLIKICLAA